MGSLEHRADRGERRGNRDGGDRTATIARWLAQKVPKSAAVTELVLTAWTPEDPDPEVLARFAREDVTAADNIAIELSALIDDFADDAGTHCKALLAWVNEEGRPYISKRFRGLCRREAQEVVRPLDGTDGSVLTQIQRHLEVVNQQSAEKDQRMFELHAKERERSDARFERMLALMDGQLVRAQERIAMLEGERDEATDAAEEAAQVAEEAADTATEAIEEMERLKEENGNEDRVAKVIEIATKQLMSGGQSPGGNGG